MAKGETYEEFIEKFKIKKTTDDCYTPPKIYEVVKDWVIKEYKLEGLKVVRPFYPGGDYKNFNYDENTIVIDNPPFSILAEIKRFYVENKIKFFLFAPGLTLFASGNIGSICHYVLGTTLVYENGAKVNTSFVSNLESDVIIRTVPELYNRIIEALNSESKKIGKYRYPKELITVSRLGKMTKLGKDIKIRSGEVHFVRKMDMTTGTKNKTGKREVSIFGAGFLTNSLNYIEKLESIEDFTSKVDRNTLDIILSEREKEIINKLGVVEDI